MTTANTNTLPTSAPSSAVAVPPFPSSADVDAIIRLALAEDVGRGDITTEATASAGATPSAEVLQKSPGGVCGLPLLARVFATLDPRVQVTRVADEGSFDGRRRVGGPIAVPGAAMLRG